MEHENSEVGVQWTGQELYERQRQVVVARNPAFDVRVAAIGLQAHANVGAVLRVADAAGCSQVLFVDRQMNVHLNRKAANISRQSENLVPWLSLTTHEFVEVATAVPATLPPLIALELTTASHNLFTHELPPQCTFVIGSERDGIPADVLGRCQFAVHIPMYGLNGSMNVTHALAVALFEHRRRYPPV